MPKEYKSKTERLLEKNPSLLTRDHDFVEIGGVKWATCNFFTPKCETFRYDEIAHENNWGKYWRLPTEKEFMILWNSTSHTIDNGNKTLLTDKSDPFKQLFFPNGCYWLNNKDRDFEFYWVKMFFVSDGIGGTYDTMFADGDQNVRFVLDSF